MESYYLKTWLVTGSNYLQFRRALRAADWIAENVDEGKKKWWEVNVMGPNKRIGKKLGCRSQVGADPQLLFFSSQVSLP